MPNYIDDLTGLYNRAGFYFATEKILKEYPHEKFCLLYWNIQQLKIINDMFGYDIGNQILVNFGKTLKCTFNQISTVLSRIERDRFACCVSLSAIANDEWKKLTVINYTIDKTEYHFHTCCGVYQIEDPNISITLMKDKARVAMERAKNSPFNHNYVWFSESMWETIVEEQKLNIGFDIAIREKQFEIYYQPICRVEDGKIIGAEALVRWNHPQRGMLSPDRFVPQFEQNGFIGVLDRYVWNEVCSAMGERISRGENIFPISINMSKAEFYDEHIFDDLHQITQKHHVPPEFIRVELTESAYVDDLLRAQSVIKELHSLGFKVIMDDFGSSYSSLGMLKDFSIDVLKVDMMFLSDFESNPKARIILESVVRMAQWMSLIVVIEGVETKKQWDYLRNIECDLAQGYYFYQPMSKEKIFMVLEEHPLTDFPLNAHSTASELSEMTIETLSLGRSKANSAFYEMVGGIGILEMTESNLEILQLNKKCFELLCPKETAPAAGLFQYKHDITGAFRTVLMKLCRYAKKQKKIKETQFFYEKTTWLHVKVRHAGDFADRSFFFFTLDNISAQKKAEQEHVLYQYSDALLKTFDKVYRLDFKTGKAEVLHTAGMDKMKPKKQYEFFGFFDRYADFIHIDEGGDIRNIIKNKDDLDRVLSESEKGSYLIRYRVDYPDYSVKLVYALLFKVQLGEADEEYLCCINCHTD